MTHAIGESLCCPKCGRAALQLAATPVCGSCGTQFFDLKGLLCLFPGGVQQKAIWEDLLAKLHDEKEQRAYQFERTAGAVHMTSLTRERLEIGCLEKLRRVESVIDVMGRSGLKPKADPQYESLRPVGLLQYYETILRDWAWHTNSRQDHRFTVESENQLMLDHMLELLESASGDKPARILVLGAGAGRLSWEIYCRMAPQLLVTVDHNPLLAYVTKHIVKDQGRLDLWEVVASPDGGSPIEQHWKASAPTTSSHPSAEKFVSIAADVWNLPFLGNSFDLVITPWLIDVVGGDVKDFIPKVMHVLSPGGRWLNCGPLKYYDGMPDQQKYTGEEIKQLLALAGMHLWSDDQWQLPYVNSPLSGTKKIEGVWSFLAEKRQPERGVSPEPIVKKIRRGEVHGWLILPHLPVPRIEVPGLPEWFANFLQLVDGHRSINDLAAALGPHIPADCEPREFVCELFQEYLVE